MNHCLGAVAGRRDARILEFLPIGLLDSLRDIPGLFDGRNAHRRSSLLFLWWGVSVFLAGRIASPRPAPWRISLGRTTLVDGGGARVLRQTPWLDQSRLYG